MDSCVSIQQTGDELVAYGREQGIDLSPMQHGFSFFAVGRWMMLWRKDEFSGSGPADEPFGRLHYNMQGEITNLPRLMPTESLSYFRGMWSEAGTLADLDVAFRIL